MEEDIYRICINGNKGQYVEVNPADEMFNLRMCKFMEALGVLKREFHESITEFKAKYDHEADNPSEQRLDEADWRWTDASRKLGKAVDDFLGEGTVRRAFPGVAVPDMFALEDFMVGLLPIIGKILRDYDEKQKEKENIRPMRFIIQPQDLK